MLSDKADTSRKHTVKTRQFWEDLQDTSDINLFVNCLGLRSRPRQVCILFSGPPETPPATSSFFGPLKHVRRQFSIKWLETSKHVSEQNYIMLFGTSEAHLATRTPSNKFASSCLFHRNVSSQERNKFFQCFLYGILHFEDRANISFYGIVFWVFLYQVSVQRATDCICVTVRKLIVFGLAFRMNHVGSHHYHSIC